MEREKYFPDEENSEEIKKDEELETTTKEKDQENKIVQKNNKLAEEIHEDAFEIEGEKKRISLVYAEVDKENFKAYMNFPAMGIYALHAGLEKNLKKDTSINSIDLNYQETDEIKKWDKYACFSINSFNFENSMKLIEQAKQAGSTVIVGGVHPTLVREKMLKNKNIDYVIFGEGDESLPKLIKGEPLEDIPGLIYRENDKIISNSFPEISLDETSVNYDEMFPDGELPEDECFGKILPYYSQKGCLWRDQSGGCFFCSAPDKQLRNKSVEKVWSELSELCDKYNPDLIRDICDSFTGNRKWLRELAEKKPDKILPGWFSYVRASEILKEGVTEDLEKIGFKYTYIGFESGDNRMLKEMVKGATAEMGIKAVEKLAEKDINVMGTFVLGAPGENKETLQNTLNFAKILHSKGNIHSITANIIIPYMGSKSFEFILQKLQENNETELYQRYSEAAHIPLEELQKTYLKLACPDLKYNDLAKFRDEINKLNEKEGPHLLDNAENQEQT